MIRKPPKFLNKAHYIAAPEWYQNPSLESDSSVPVRAVATWGCSPSVPSVAVKVVQRTREVAYLGFRCVKVALLWTS